VERRSVWADLRATLIQALAPLGIYLFLTGAGAGVLTAAAVYILSTGFFYALESGSRRAGFVIMAAGVALSAAEPDAFIRLAGAAVAAAIWLLGIDR
jgi:hypothetical protein